MRIVGPGGPLQQQWSGDVRLLEPQATLPRLRAASMPRVCESWNAAVGDAGVAGAVLSKLRQAGGGPLWLIRTAAMDAVAMTDEMIALTSGQERWEMTFCTYLHSLPRSADCRLRWVLPDSPAMRLLHNIGPDRLIDLRSGANAILVNADDRLVEAARKGMAVGGLSVVDDGATNGATGVAAPLATAALDTPSGMTRRRGFTPAELDREDPETAGPSIHVLPPPPKEQSSMFRWSLIGAAIGILPALAFAFFVYRWEPAPVAAMPERDTPALRPTRTPNPNNLGSSDVTPDNVTPDNVTPDNVTPDNVTPDNVKRDDVTPNAGPHEQEPPQPKPTRQRDTKPRTDRRADEPPPDVTPPTPAVLPVPQTLRVPIKLPTSALSLTLDEQPLHRGSGVDEIELHRVAPILYPIEFRLDPAGPSGHQDLIAVAAAAGQQRKMGTIKTGPDDVLFAWSADTKRNVASAFILAHEFLIKDATHHSTIQLEFADPIELPSPRVPATKNELPLPEWILPEFECRVKPAIYSSTSSDPLQFDPLLVEQAEPLGFPEWMTKKQDISGLKDPLIRQAIFSIAGDIIGSGTSRRIRLPVTLQLAGSGKPFPWNERLKVVREQSAKHNEKEKKKSPTQRNSMSSSDRMTALDAWGGSLRCEAEWFVRVNSRDILWGRSGGKTE